MPKATRTIAEPSITTGRRLVVGVVIVTVVFAAASVVLFFAFGRLRSFLQALSLYLPWRWRLIPGLFFGLSSLLFLILGVYTALAGSTVGAFEVGSGIGFAWCAWVVLGSREVRAYLQDRQVRS